MEHLALDGGRAARDFSRAQQHAVAAPPAERDGRRREAMG
jgi:hypothetical protein